ncbi:MAG: hypothetical protein MI799_08420 [Desulfobacterales bacterium]|nr:hypothetical protein [Desulfobacterales bacterium]
MNIHSIQGMNAYTDNMQVAGTASVRNNNKEETGAQTYQENTQPLQQAFQVEITQQAMTLQAQSKENPAEEDDLDQLPAHQNQITQQTGQSRLIQQGSLLDIIA